MDILVKLEIIFFLLNVNISQINKKPNSDVVDFR